MLNLGKATPRVVLLDVLPNINKDKTIHNFDVTAHSWDIIQNSPYFTPLLSEHVVDPLGAFAAIYPSKRKAYVDNFIQNGDGTTIAPSGQPYILWRAIGGSDSSGAPINTKGVVRDLIINGKYDNYTLIQPDNYPRAAGAYSGPEWIDDARDKEPPPDDEATITKWKDWIGADADITTLVVDDDSTSEDDDPLTKLVYVNQRAVKDGLWWGIESTEFLNENMPFWVTIKKGGTPSSADHETAIIISIGVGSDSQAFDLYLSNNKKPRLVDYYLGRDVYDGFQNRAQQNATNPSNPVVATTPQAPSNEYEFENDFSRLIDSNKDLEIGFMTIGGRLVITVNNNTLVYTRIQKNAGQDTGRIAECKINPGSMRIYGTNIQAVINVSPMVFAPLSMLALPIPTIPPTIDPETSVVTTPTYANILNNGDIGGSSVARLPSDPDSNIVLYGIDSREFDGDGGTDNPTGVGFHKDGEVSFKSASNLGLDSLASSDFYVLVMKPDDVIVTFSGTQFTMRNGGVPYFFRLKGGAKTSKPENQLVEIEVTKDIISITETKQAPDYFHVKGNANISLYNKGGKYDYLKRKQYGIVITWGWNGGQHVSFTGMTLNAASIENAGRETIDVTCEDYMFILNNRPIINSPFYDGMVMFYAAKDMLNRAGVKTVVNDWGDTDDYFLPSGYAFTKPAVRFSSNQKIFECLMDVVKRAEAFLYFDRYGIAHVKKLPGGLFSVGASESIVGTFTRDPAGPNTILGEKNVQYDLSSTVNRISIFTVDRDTRNAVFYTKSAVGQQDILQYRRLVLEDQAALGEYNVAVARAEELSLRLFYPIRKISFSTVGDSIYIEPLDFIEVDGEEFRLLSVARKYTADSNDFTNEYNAEWLGGA